MSPVLDNIALKQELKLLPRNQSYVLEQFYCQHKTLEEISFSMNIALRTVRHHRQAGLRNLRSRLHCIIE
ncbi:MAG: sigma-70 family RNA polymerase sigma factor [Phascolarctobacterium sp.]|nr:sigma-70 family RNA polymerase sigma factor [Phascolarctobacterium sp.]